MPLIVTAPVLVLPAATVATPIPIFSTVESKSLELWSHGVKSMLDVAMSNPPISAAVVNRDRPNLRLARA